MADEFVPEEWPLCCLGQVVVTGAGLRCRETPRADGVVLGAWETDQVLDLWAKLAGWWLVQARASGLTGWSWGEFLRVQ